MESTNRYIDADGVDVEIHYMRSNVQPGEVGRRVYTPYVFDDGELVSIGW